MILEINNYLCPRKDKIGMLLNATLKEKTMF